MGNLKRIILVALTVVGCCVLLAGCSSTTPSQTADSFLQAMKAQDTESMAKYYSGDASDLAGSWLNESVGGDIDGSGDLTDDEKAVMQKFAGKLCDFDYELGDEKVDGNNATVNVSVTTYDFGEAVDNALKDYLEEALAQAFSGKELSTAKSNKIFYKAFGKQLDKLTDKSVQTDAQLSLTKGDDGSWKVSELDNDAVNALTGQLLDKVQEYEKAFSGSSSSSSSSSPKSSSGSAD